MRCVFALIVALLLAAPASSNTLVLAEQSGAYLEVVVQASDGVSTATDVADLVPFVGSAEATLQGILDPQLVVSSLIIEVPETTVDLSFGSAEVPARLTMHGYYEWAPNNATIPLGGSDRIPTGQLVDFAMSGALEAFGETTPFDFSLSDYVGSTELLDGFFAPLAFAPDPFTLTLGYAVIDDGFSGFIGSMGGVDFSIWRALLVFDSVTFVPEPSTALLLAAGLAGLAAAGRRRQS